ncbi:MAG: PD-(D/E)XK nuclease family transposase [Eubacterium sp.]|nr:PD-(D/E)XK nuclease family transposase [Eubacterium sp.]
MKQKKNKKKNNKENIKSKKVLKPASYKLEDILGAAIPRAEALAAIQEDQQAYRLFSGFPPVEQERLIAFIQGAQGLKITYDTFFKHVMNPDMHPSRLEHFLSAVLEQPVKIRMVLPMEGVRMADAGSFVIMDIVVELSDGTIVNVEIQKIGYLFPGERASCYSADFIMRQYNRVRDDRGERFSFRDLKPVILIVLMESSPAPFKSVFPSYIHREKTVYDSGALVKSLSKTIYISLDTFHAVVHNINTELEAWLMFLSTDHPADMIRLVSAFPEFLTCYRDIMEFRRHPKELMHMYSEALAILDRNTEIYMCEELKKENIALKEENENLRAEKDAALSEKEMELSEKEMELSEKEMELSEKDAEIQKLKKQLHQLMFKD